MAGGSVWLLAVWGVLAACSDNNIQLPLDNREQDVLRVLSVGTGTPDTRSIMTTDSLNIAGKRIGVYMLAEDGTEYVPVRGGSNTSVYEYDGTNWNCTAADENHLLRLPFATEETVKATAFYPAVLIPHYSTSGNYVSGIHILASDDFAATKQTDYLYAAYVTGLNTMNRSAAFTMKHALAKLTFKVYRTSVLDETKLVSLQIMDAGGGSNLQAGSGKSMILETGLLQGLVGQSVIILVAANDSQKQNINLAEGSGETATASCLVAPAPGIEYLSFQLTTSQGTADSEQNFLTSSIKMVSASPVSNEYLRWKAGSHYVFTIVLDGMKAGVSDIQVCKWESDTDTFIPIS